MRIDQASTRFGAPRLIGISGVLLGILVAILVGYSGGASAAPGDADLSITKTDSPDPVVQGSNVTYTITVTNNGPVSQDIDFGSATTTAGTCDRTGNTVACNLGTLAANTSAIVTIVVKA